MNKTFLPLIAGFLLSTSSMALAGLPSLEALFQAGGIEATASDRTDTSVTYENVVLRSGGMPLTIAKMQLAELDGGRVAVSIENLVVGGISGSGMRLSIDGLSTELAGFDVVSGNILCSWTRAAEKITMNGVRGQFGSGDGLAASLSIPSAEFLPYPGDASCNVSGDGTVESVDFTFRDTSRILLEGLAFKANFPVSTGRALESDKNASLSLAAKSFEFMRQGEVSAIGMLAPRIGAETTEKSLAAVLHYLSRLSNRDPAEGSLLSLLEFWNAVTHLDGSAVLTSESVRLHAPGVVKPEYVKNFQRAGLSSVTGGINTRIKLDNRMIFFSLDADFIGILNTIIGFRGFALPFEKDKLRLASKGVDLGFHAIPDLRISEFDLRYTESGIERAMMDMTGGSLSSFLQGLSASPESVWFTGPMRQSLEAMARFFGAARENGSMAFSATPGQPVAVAEAGYLLLTDPQKFSDVFNVSVLPINKEQVEQ